MAAMTMELAGEKQGTGVVVVPKKGTMYWFDPGILVRCVRMMASLWRITLASRRRGALTATRSGMVDLGEEGGVRM